MSENTTFKICNQCGGIDGNHASGCGGNPLVINSPRYSPTPPAPSGAGTASKPPAPSVVETPLCDRLQHAFVAEGTSSFYVQLEKLKTMERASTAAQLEVDRLKAEVAARYTVEEIRGWLRQKNTSMEGDAVVVKPTLGIAAFIANQRKEKGT